MPKEKYCIVVDAYSTGKQIAPALKKKGHRCINIQSAFDLSKQFSHNKNDFSETIVYDGNFEKLIHWLQNQYDIELCIPGSESGVLLADQIASALKLQTSNGTELSKARRDKYEMTKIVGEAGLKVVKHFRSANSDYIIEWVNQEVGEYPVVIKPIDSANNDSIFICLTPDDIKKAVETILNTTNVFGKTNNEVYAQSFNYGQEYIVNTVSANGQHFPIDIWRIQRKPDTVIYDRAEFVSSDELEYEKLSLYVANVLNALQIRYGAATTELKYTADGGPVLLECAARPMAGAPISLIEKLIGFTQISLMVDAYLDLKKFTRIISEEKVGSKKGHGLAVMLISDVSGLVSQEMDFSLLKSLPSFHDLNVNIKPGKELKKTIDYSTCPGEIYLYSADRGQLYQDHETIRLLEQQGLYRKIIALEKV